MAVSGDEQGVTEAVPQYIYYRLWQVAAVARAGGARRASR